MPAREAGGRDERGAVTAELALGLPVLLAVTAALAWMLAVGVAQVRVVDSAREAARMLARGDNLASAEQVAKAFRLVTTDPNVQAIFVNIFGGITRGDVVANGIREALSQVQVKVPIVVRLSGTNAEEGRSILAEAGLTAVTSMDEAAARVVKAAIGA